ncbi:MAG TPA: EF-Tu/IF-2/RF-3 family GTPase [Candidatus Thalassarchaeaceae archaeon]|jgi:selenocysteine-specific translation elongation factor|nr:EF-Tu/IF-2/RF-3 family GTPase [Candidatus Thalassarchaeaceae archaeon]HJM67299.1 EF-Tu/IF-2/RF-3 family GTPase [Candidatus Thalassarchaeaceae archaeon]
MPVLNVAFVGSEELARTLAKKGDVRDIESYVYKEVVDGETRILSLLRPLRHPERLRPLLSVLNVAKAGIVEIAKVDAALGEVLVAFGAADIAIGHAIISPEEGGWVDPEQVRVILEQAGLADWILHEEMPDEHTLRNSLLSKLSTGDENEPLVIPIDQHFNVKGVGLVAIGYVQAGTVSKHDEIHVLPAQENGIARSLQVMDDDVEQSIAGDRVGVALRNLREESLHRGCILTLADENALSCHNGSKFTLLRAPFQKRELNEGDIVHAAVDLQFQVGRIIQVEGDNVTVEWEQPLWIQNRDAAPVIIVQLDAGNMRIMGVGQSIAPA